MMMSMLEKNSQQKNVSLTKPVFLKKESMMQLFKIEIENDADL